MLMVKHRWLFFAYVFFALPARATFPDLNAMLEAITPTAAVIAPDLNTLIFALDGLNNLPQQKQDALLTLTPTADLSLRAASEGSMRQIFSTIADRLDTYSEEKGVWAQLLGQAVSQNERSGIPGYRAGVLGGVIGRDQSLKKKGRIGVAGSYQHADVRSKGSSGSFLTIGRYQGTAYGRYDTQLKKKPLFVQGAFTIANNQYKNHRKILVPPESGIGFARTAFAEFAAWEFDATIEKGIIWQKNHFRAIPKVLLNYAYLAPQSYIEQDAFGLDLMVKYDKIQFLTAGLGSRLEYKNEFPNVWVVPHLNIYFFRDLAQASQQATAQFLSGGFAFLSQGPRPAPNSIEIGAGLTVHSYQHILVQMQYDYAARSDYHRHQAFLKVRYEW